MDSDGGEREQAEEEVVLQPSAADCSICFRPWTADGPHRISCLPCGHVIGRSCLETWFELCGENNGKCPQCKRTATQEEITNLYLPRIHDQTSGEEREGRASESELEKRVCSVETRTSRLECQEVNTQLAYLRRQMADVRRELTTTVVHASDVEQIESEIAGVWDHLNEPDLLQDEVQKLSSTTEEMKKEMAEMRTLFSEMKSKLDEMPVRKKRR